MNKYIYGIDVGGTTIKVGLFDFISLNLIQQTEVITPKNKDGKELVKNIYEIILECNVKYNIRNNQIVGVGIDVPCPIKKGFVENCANLDIRQIDLQSEMYKYLSNDVKVIIANDATIAAFGENASLSKPYNNAVLITLGTGVGGGIILDGKIVEGSTGFAGEIGHIKVSKDIDETCGCGSKGCLEQICGTDGIINYTKKILLEEDSSLDPETLTVKSIFDAAKDNDKVALKTVHRVAEHLGIAASIISMIVEPEVFIIGGGISRAGSFLLDLVQTYYIQNARFSTGKIPFRLAKTGNDAGMIGSALLVKSLL